MKTRNKISTKIKNAWYLLTYRLAQPKLIIQKASFSGDGAFIDIRYWISRPDKISPKMRPYLITIQNQTLNLMQFSKFGAIQSKIRKHTNTGILLFYNKNKLISNGDVVALCWDNLRSEYVVVK